MTGRMAVLVVLAAGPSLSVAAELKPEALERWDGYTREADARVAARLDAGKPFLSSDEANEQAARLRRGEIVIKPLVDRGSLSIPDGLIHDWLGAIFIPNARLEEVLAVAHDYDHYKDYYAPAVADSKALDCTGAEQRFSMLLRRKVLFVNAAVRGQYESRDFIVNEHRWYTIAATTQVREISNYGQPAERLLPPDQGSGFLWRLHSIVRYEERDGGVYVELEAIGLTRGVPASLRWFVNPIVARLSRNSLITSLKETRDAVALRPQLLSQLH